MSTKEGPLRSTSCQAAEHRLGKKAYKASMPALQRRLHQLQHTFWKERIGSLILIEGWDGAGKGAVVGKLTERLEPRGFQLYAIREPRSLNTQLPWLWPFWNRLPRYGEMALFDQSWYGRLFVDRVEGELTEKMWRRRCRDIVQFERTLLEDRYLVIKLFLHISYREKKKRLKSLAKDTLTRWKVPPSVWFSLRHYEDYVSVIDDTLQRTATEKAPWTIIQAADLRYARAQVFATLIEVLTRHLDAQGHPVPEQPWPQTEALDDVV